jgi:signal transduction histidine kinase
MPDQLPSIILPPEFRHNVFLAFKEAITNIVRHAGASFVFVRLRVDAAGMILEIEDDGRGLAGLDEKKLLTRNGVRGMEKRLAAIGGTFTIAPRPGKGTLVRLSAPFEKTV